MIGLAALGGFRYDYRHINQYVFYSQPLN